MKVECIAINSKETESPIMKNTWLTVGHVYHVLSIFVSHLSSVEYRLLTDDGKTPGVFDASLFKVVSNILPPNWIANYEADLFFEIAPKPWTRPGFWEEYFDGMSDAVALFNSERESIVRFDP